MVVVLLAIVAFAATRGSSDDEKVVDNQVADVQVPGTAADGADPENTTPTEAEPGSAPLPKFERPENDPAVGMTIPTVSGSDLQGDPMTIEADGQAKVILFVAHWCPHCQR